MEIERWQELPNVLASELKAFIVEWEKHFDRVKQLQRRLEQCHGQTCMSVEKLLETLRLNEQIGAEMERLLIGSQLLLEIEESNEAFLSLSLQAEALLADIQAQTDVVADEIRELDCDLLRSWMADSFELATYEHFFKSLQQEQQEASDSELLSSLQELSAYLERTHRTLLTHDIQFASVMDESGVTHNITFENFRTLMGSTDRVFRENVYRVVYDNFYQFRKTFAANLNVQFRKTWLGALESESGPLQKMLRREGISIAGYQAFLEMVNDHVGLNHQYYALSARNLQLESMAPYDQYVTKNAMQNPKLTFEEATELIIDAFAFLGMAYQQDLRDVLHRVIITPQMSNFTVNLYAERPVIVMQFTGTLPSLLVLAHEAGHAVHMMRANMNQSYLYTEIPDVASEMVALLHENIVLHHLRDQPPHEEWRSYVEFLRVDNYRYNLFKATMLFEFERNLHQAIQEDQMLTATFLSDTFAAYIRSYYGEAFEVDDRISLDWIRVLHLYTPFYLAAYPLAFALADRVAQALREDGATMIDRFFAFLESGGSMAPSELFAIIGVHLEDKSMYQSVFQTFELLLKHYFEANE